MAFGDDEVRSDLARTPDDGFIAWVIPLDGRCHLEVSATDARRGAVQLPQELIAPVGLELFGVPAKATHPDVERRVDRMKELHLGSEGPRQLCSLGDGRKGSCLGVLDSDENPANCWHGMLHQLRTRHSPPANGRMLLLC